MACAFSLLAPAACFANPSGPAVVNGQVVFSRPAPNALNVSNSPGAIINWQGFSIGRGELTRFIQQSPSSAVLNRVVGADPSSILGQLSSNGRVFLINPHGIVFGAGAVIDTAGLVASTLNISDADFAAGRYRFIGNAASGTIVNQGTIRTTDKGPVFLLAPNIENSGVIETPGGNLVLAAGRSVELTSFDLNGIRFAVQAPQDSAVNLGRLVADGGAAGMFAGTLKHSGEIRANTVARDAQGRIVLSAARDITLESGSVISASGAAGGERNGGEVRIVAQGALDMQRGSAVRVDGGPDGGNGGFLEISGRQAIALNGAYTGIAKQAGYRNGSLLLDPDYINIVAGGTDNTGGDGIVLAGDSPGATLNIAPSALSGAWTDVSLAAVNDISVLSALASGDLAAGGALSLSAGRDILIGAPIGSAAARFDHSVNLTAARDVAVNAAIYLNNNTLRAKAGNTISAAAAIDVGSGTAGFDAGTAMTQSAPITAGTVELSGPGAMFTLDNPGNQVATLKVNAGTVKFASSTSTVLAGLPKVGGGTESLIAPVSPASGSLFGDPISVKGDLMVIGAPDGQFGATGKAYVYRWNGSGWVFEATLAPPPGVTTANFGKAVAVEGNHIVVGAPETTDADGTYRSGAAFAYEYSGGAWSAGSKLSFSDKVFESVFGYALAIDSGRLVVGGGGRTSEGGFWSGKIWFYDFSSGTGQWVEKGHAVQSDWASQSNAYFGNSLDISGDRLIVGSWHTYASTGLPGSAYIFNFNPATRVWTQSAKLTSPGAADDWFGMDVSIAGNVAVAGASNTAPGGATRAGSAYVFNYNGTSWVQQQVIKPSDVAANDNFGFRVSARDGVIVASSYGADLPGKADAGAVYLFKNNGASWVQDGKVTASNAAAGNIFGYGMYADDQQRLFVGAVYAIAGGVASAGSVYAYAPGAGFTTSSSLTVASGGNLTQSTSIAAGGAVDFAASGDMALNAPLVAGGNNVTLSATGTVTQSAPISAMGLALLGSGGTHVLTNAGNAITTLAANTGSIQFANGAGLTVGTVGGTGGITATGNVMLSPVGSLTQTAPIVAPSFELLGAGASHTLTNPANVIGTVAANTGSLNVVNNGNLAVGTAGATTGIAATGNTTLYAGGGGSLVVGQNVSKGGSAPAAAALRADNSVIVNGDVAIAVTGSNTLDVTLNADRDGSGAGQILMNAGASVISNGGNIILGGGANPLSNPAIGIGAATSSDKTGVYLNGAALQAGAGDISVRGQGFGGTTSSANGVVIGGSTASVQTTSGSITIEGTGGAGGTSFNSGVLVHGGATITSASGAIDVKGSGGGAQTDNYGINLFLGGRVSSTAGAPITLTGTGGAGTDRNRGVYLWGAGTEVRAVGGSIAVTGTAQGSGIENEGIALASTAAVTASGAATVTLTGTGGNGVGNNAGVVMRSGSAVSTVDGALVVDGAGRGSGWSNLGVYMEGGAQIRSSGAGALTVTGSGASTADSNNEGVFLRDAGTAISAVNAPIVIEATGGGGGNYNTGFVLWRGAAVSSSGSAPITITGIGVGTSSNGIWTGEGSNVIGGATATGDVTLIAASAAGDAISLANVDIHSSGALTLKPVTPGTTIGLAGGAGAFNVDAAEFDAVSGFSSIVLGAPAGTGLISVGAYTVTGSGKHVIIQNPGAGSAGITLNGTIFMNDNGLALNTTGPITLNAALYAADLSLPGSTNIGGPGDLAVRGAFNWAGGTIGGSGAFNTSSTSLITLSGGGTKTFTRPVWNNYGTVNWTGGTLSAPNSLTVINNDTGGVFNAQGAGTLSGGVATFNNLAGATLNKNSAGTSDFQAGFGNAGTVNATAGVLRFSGPAGYAQNAGVTNLNGGILEVTGAGGMTLNGGVLAGSGSLLANVTNNGATVKPGGSPGTLSIVGNYTQGPGGTLEVDLGGLTQGVNYDLLSVTGTVALDGALKVNFYGGFAPAVGNEFDIVAAGGGITGNFATINSPAGYAMGNDIIGNVSRLDVYSVAALPPSVLPPAADPSAQTSQAQQNQLQIMTVVDETNAQQLDDALQEERRLLAQESGAPADATAAGEQQKRLPLCR